MVIRIIAGFLSSIMKCIYFQELNHIIDDINGYLQQKYRRDLEL